MKQFTNIEFECPITGETYEAMFESKELMTEAVKQVVDKYGVSQGDSIITFRNGKEQIEETPVFESAEEFLDMIEKTARIRVLNGLSDKQKALLGLVEPKEEKVLVHWDVSETDHCKGACGVSEKDNFFMLNRSFPRAQIANNEEICPTCMKLWEEKVKGKSAK